MKDTLNVEIKDGKLQIIIGIEALVYGITNGSTFFDYYLDDIIVTDQNEFAQAILEQLNAEEEDGSTMVHRMLERAAEKAVENGCEGVELPE